MPSIAAPPIEELERAELHSVLESQLFARSPTLAQLLSYLCEKKFAHHADQIKEYSIALEVFGRHETFDQDSDSIVRVQVNRLRKRLAEFYTGEGATHELRLTIPVGHYVPMFEKVEPNPDAITPTAPEKTSGEPLTHISTQLGWWTRSGIWILLGAAVLLGLMAALAIGFQKRTKPLLVPVAPQQVTAMSEPPIGLPVGDEIRILAGASRSYVDRAGKMWSPDAFFSGGKSVRTSMQHIWRTQDASIYRSSRQGEFQYDIPLRPGAYELRLHFAETFYGPEDIGGGGEGSRLMMVRANGQLILNDFDVVLDAGASRTADVKVFTGIGPAEDGKLHLNFSSLRGGSAMLSAIELLPGFKNKQRPVRIIARDVPYYSNDSRWWSPDTYFKGGQLTASDDPATDTDDPEMYETERWGHFSYAIPVTAGHYTATFHFIERRFDAANRDRYADSSDASQDTTSGRLFNVFCNGKAILKDIDLIKETGENRPLVRQVSGLEPNGQGKLLLEFVPVRNYATVTAIEVIPE